MIKSELDFAIVLKIIRYGVEGNIEKARNYAVFLADKLEEAGDVASAKMIRKNIEKPKIIRQI